MRALLAIVIFMGSMLALNSTADAGRKSKRGAKPPPCDYDLIGEFRGFPCWARKAFRDGRGR